MNRFFFLLLVSFSIPRLAHAYLDPGTGSMIIQVVVGLVAGTAVTVKLYWAKVRKTVATLLDKLRKR